MEDEIVKTLKYFDHFEYPPTFDEVWIFLGKSSRKEKLNCYLEKMAAGDDITAEYIDENRYALQRSEEILKKYKNRYYQSKKYIEESLPILIGLKLIPTIKYIGYSGSLAMKNASGQSDIDLFIICCCLEYLIYCILVIICISLIQLNFKSLIKIDVKKLELLLKIPNNFIF